MRPEVGGHDDDGIGEVDGAAMPVRDSARRQGSGGRG
jgi:hypothetical protein